MSDSVVTYFDAQCRCGRKIGWHGRLLDRPKCPRCGHRPDQASLDHDQAEIDEFRDLLREMKTANPGWEKWQKARVAAGLTLRQAARVLEVEPKQLCDIEQGRAQASQELADRMARCYSGEGEPT